MINLILSIFCRHELEHETCFLTGEEFKVCRKCGREKKK